MKLRRTAVVLVVIATACSRAPEPQSASEPLPAAREAETDSLIDVATAPLAEAAAAYAASDDVARRIEIIYEAGERTDGLALLAPLFETEAEEAIREVILAVAETIDDDQQVDSLLALLALASRASEAAEIRANALAILSAVQDQRAVPRWRALLADGDDAVRELAGQQLEELRESAAPR